MESFPSLEIFVFLCLLMSSVWPEETGRRKEGGMEGRKEGRRPQSYTLVVECPCGKFVLFCPPLKVLNVCSGCMPVSVLGIMVMVFGVMSGMSSGERRSVSV